jgi:hypothetical protein
MADQETLRALVERIERAMQTRARCEQADADHMVAVEDLRTTASVVYGTLRQQRRFLKVSDGRVFGVVFDGEGQLTIEALPPATVHCVDVEGSYNA